MGQSKDLNLKETKQFAIDMAKDAAKIAMKTFGKVHEYRSKESKEQLVSQVDIDSENLIKSRIFERFPDHAILAEESGKNEKDSEYLWIIDPIDGTRNYLHGHPTFGISIALAKNKKVVLGVVYFPVYDWMFTAVKGNGAELNGRKIKVSDRTTDNDTLGCYGCDFHRQKDEQMAVLSRYVDLIRKVRIEGAATFGFCLVANGTYDAYIQRFLKPWDYAASCLIIEEAGGKVTDYKGTPWTIEMENLIASNGRFHDKLLKVVR